MAGNNEVKIVFSAKTEEAANAVRDVAKKIDNLGESGQKAKSSVDKLDTSLKSTKESALKAGDSARATTASWAEMAIGIDSTINLLNRAAGLAKSALDLAKDAARFQEAKDNFSRFAASVGADSNKILSALKKASAGTIETRNLITTASRALALGVTTDADKIGNLMEIARAKAKILGTDVTSAFNDIVTGIGRGSPQILDNLGIRIPEGFTATAKGMDSAKKTALLLDEVLKAENETLKGMGSQTESSADKFRQFETSLNDLKQNISEKFLPTATTLVDWLKDVVEWGGDAADALEWYAKGDSVFNLSDTRNLGVIGELDALRRQKEGLEKNRAEVVEKLKNTSEGTVKGFFTPQSFRMEWGEELDGYDRKLEEVNERIKELEKTGINIVHLEQENAKEAAKIAEEKKKAADEAERQKKAAEEAEKLAKKQREELEKQFAALSKQIDSGINKALGVTNQSLSDNITLMYNAGIAAMGFNAKVDEAAAAEYKLNQEAEKLSDSFFKAFENANKLEKAIENIGDSNFENVINDLKSGSIGSASVGLLSTAGLSVLGSAAGTNALITASGNAGDDIKSTSKNFWTAIKTDYCEGMAAAMTQGIMDSNLAEALSSFGKAQAGNYGSQLLGGLLSGGTKSLSGAFATGGAGWGLVAGVAIDYVASNWKKWTGDKGKVETFASVANTKERGSNAYLNTYKSELNPYLSDEDLYRIYDARSDVWSKGMTVSWSERNRNSHWLTGAKSYHDTTPQSTYDVIAALEKANELAEKSAVQKEREMDLLAAQGKGYQVVTEQVNLLKSAVDRISFDYREFGWTSGEKFSIDLSENIQDLKKAYYEALKEYGNETASRTSQKNNTFLSMVPFLNGITTGDAGFTPTYTKSNSGFLAGFLGLSGANVRYDYYNNLNTTTANEGAYAMYNAFQEVFENYLNDSESSYGSSMLDLVKQAGSNQFDLSSLQYSDPLAYSEAYIDILEKQQNAAYQVMLRSEEIYGDMTKTVEERQGALQDYQDAQEAYYNSKLEIMANEAAKEEEIKKREQQANLLAQEKMETLLGFTGEIARTGNNIYILEGADQIGALEELLPRVKDNPEAVAAVQSLILAANNRNKFGRI